MAKRKIRAGHVFAALLALAVLLPLPAHGTLAGLPVLCMTRSLFGVPCPFCGMTRSLVCTAHGELAEAFAYHPLGPLLFVSIALWAVVDIFWRGWQPPPRIVQALTATCAASLALAWALRLCGFWPLPSS